MMPNASEIMNWRLTFGFDGEDAVLADYQDYH
jgi:plasmid maintenance system killer protein